MIALVALVTFWAYVAHCAVVPASHTTLAHLGAGLSVPPQVIPGPGLPSLASLGLTNELLFDPEFQARMRAKFPDTQLAARSKLSKRFDPKCMRYPAGNTRGADACAAYLRSLDTTPCVATQDPVIMCAANVGEMQPQEYSGQETIVHTVLKVETAGLQGGLPPAAMAT
ncbi:hypothetical protein NQ176_g3757 [Zarea fungicola]|uniref:Uncharacterized protein n=1 Tax=Zarea fungicola TaxID=93591 RepID=A0ACC1NI04_9HYPO|nr:hypothetical protein NQ176_g3757 [Lecanicillium fungicola]